MTLLLALPAEFQALPDVRFRISTNQLKNNLNIHYIKELYLACDMVNFGAKMRLFWDAFQTLYVTKVNDVRNGHYDGIFLPIISSVHT